jgi:hypothetical protein
MVLLSSGACGREPPPPSPPPPGRPAAVAPAPQDTAFAGTTAPIDRIRATRAGAAGLHGVEATATQAYDRIVFAFTGDSVPGYHVEYVHGPVRRCGSGDPVSVEGPVLLVIRFAPAQAHDEAGRPFPAERERAVGLPVVKEMKLVCDFEGQVEWVLGVAGTVPYRISELAGPARLALDLRHVP